MFATPVVYSVSSIPADRQWIVNLNPLTGIFECFRYGFLGSGSFTPETLIMSTGIIAVILLLGVLIFNKVEKSNQQYESNLLHE
jgi:lipopolysaccharide transport system permease protein